MNLTPKHSTEFELQFYTLSDGSDSLSWEQVFKLFKLILKKDDKLKSIDLEKTAKNFVKYISGSHSVPIDANNWIYSNIAYLLSSDRLIERQFKS